MKREHPAGLRLASLAAVIALSTAGCVVNHYEIELTPNGDSVRRELTAWRQRTANDKAEVVAFPAEELARIAGAYDAPVPDQSASRHKFSGVFASQLPDDVGGSGSYTHWTTSLGSVSAYVERVRGNDDLLADVEKRQQAADRIADLLIGWFTSELEGEAGFAKLREFLDVRLRRDLKNLSLYGWAFGMERDREDATVAEWLIRVEQYFIERSYFTPDQLPLLDRAVREATRSKPARLLAWLQRFVATRMGIGEDEPIPASLGFLADQSVLQTSLDDYLRTTDEFERMQAEWNREKETKPDAETPQPIGVLVELATRAFLSSFNFGPRDQVNVKLAATAQPFLTNGQWDEQAGQVRWSHGLRAAGASPAGFPTLLYALWSSPHQETQRTHFGRLVLEGEALGKYCEWHRGLAAPEVKEWETFMASLRPGAELTKRLTLFRFSDEPPAVEGDSDDTDLAATPRELILSALSNETVNH